MLINWFMMISAYGRSTTLELVRSWSLPFSQVTALLHNFLCYNREIFCKFSHKMKFKYINSGVM